MDAAGIESLPDGVHVIDSGYLRPRLDAIYLLVEAGRVAIVESGTAHSLPRVLAALAHLGLPADAVDWVLLTHVHLDHAGGAGALMQALPNAQLAVHPRGARHMIDPTRLWSATVAVYGEAFALREYGALVPVEADRVVEAHDGMQINLAGRIIEVADTPGHARHHVCYWDARTRGWLTGDAFGLSYRETHVGDRAFALPTSTPSQFEPDAMHQSIDRLMACEPVCMYPTHYGRITEPFRLAQDLHRLVDAYVAIAETVLDEADPARQYAELCTRLTHLVGQEAASQGWAVQGEAALALYAGDLALNAQGLQGWIKQKKA